MSRLFDGHRSRIAQRAELVLVFATAVMPASRVTAQDVPNRESALEMRNRFLIDLDTLYTKFVALAEAIPAEKYSWRPGEGVRSIGEALMHVASEFYVYTPMAYGAPASPVVGRGQEAFKKFEANSTKPEVLKHLKESFAYTRQQLQGLDGARLSGKQKLFGQDLTILETRNVAGHERRPARAHGPAHRVCADERDQAAVE
ncbi:MAG: DinB family protein [Gemmatimonadaceae bacterium]